jgi:signal transduction histidine kinase
VEILNLCRRYKLINESAIARVRKESQARAGFVDVFALVAISGVAVLGVLLAYILIKQVLGPIRQLALETAPANPVTRVPDEVKALSSRVHSLIEDVDQAQIELERSQEHLLQSGKWAMVGKLAAGVAHSIRNPLTSVNMRLFSLKRSLAMSSSQQEDFEVISEEIRHIDTIVRNFLEFSRPPKLKMQRVSPSDVVDMALVLLRYRLESYGVEVKLKREHRLPEIWADPDQLKEVLVNLVLNACEVMVNGGSITIREEEQVESPLGPAAVIRVSDTGPGIPESVRDKIFQPFFSTKEEGTGLGLSIATRIIEEHGGRLELESKQKQGATFHITLPIRKDESWATS